MSRWLKRSDKDSQTNEDKLKKNKGDTGQVTKQMMNGGRTGGQSLRRAASGLDVAEEETPPSKAEPLWGSGRRPTARLEIKWLAPEGFDSGTEPAAPLQVVVIGQLGARGGRTRTARRDEEAAATARRSDGSSFLGWCEVKGDREQRRLGGVNVEKLRSGCGEVRLMRDG